MCAAHLRLATYYSYYQYGGMVPYHCSRNDFAAPRNTHIGGCCDNVCCSPAPCTTKWPNGPLEYGMVPYGYHTIPYVWFWLFPPGNTHDEQSGQNRSRAAGRLQTTPHGTTVLSVKRPSTFAAFCNHSFEFIGEYVVFSNSPNVQ
jgi:hypothetical protein